MAESALITAVEYQRKRPDRVNVYLDGAFEFAIAARVAEEAGLRRGLRLSADEVRQLRDQDQAHRAYESALGFLSYRPRSEAEVRQSLQRKGFLAEEVDAAVQRLQGAGLLDDDAFARFWVENRDAFSPRGGRALRAELRQKGLGDETIRAALPAERDDAAGALTLARQRARQLRGLERRVFQQRLGGHLARRGYGYDTIRPVVEAVWAELQSGGEEPEGEPHDD